MALQLASDALFIIQTLQQAGYDVFVVGGAVRDLLINQDQFVTNHTLLKDYDFTTNAKPEQIQAVFPDSFYENEFGTVAISPERLWEQMGVKPAVLPTINSDNSRIFTSSQATKLHPSLITTEINQPKHNTHSLPNYEITTYRSKEVYAATSRKPDSLEWGSSLEEDVVRRDFTINALALKIEPHIVAKLLSTTLAAAVTVELTEQEYELLDFHNGLTHVQERRLVAVGDPNTRFQEDALRMLRAIRFSVQLNFEIDPPTYQAITEQARLLTHISWERIRDEFLKMLSSDYPAEAIQLLDETGLLAHILPELQTGKGVTQAGHHTTDVWTHSLDALRECPATDPVVRLATLLHDIGKPKTQDRSSGSVTFYNHEVVGAHLAKTIAKRLKLPKRDIDRIFILVRNHMFYYQPHNTDASIRRFMRKVGLEQLDDILDLREADRLGSGARKTSWRLEEMKQRMIEQLHQPMAVTDLAINGHDVITELNLQPGPEIGRILNELLEIVLENPDHNTKENLLQLAKNLVVTQ